MKPAPLGSSLVMWVLCSIVVLASPQGGGEPRYEVVSIKKNVGTPMASGFQERPDGGLSAAGVTVATLIARAYPPAVPIEMEGLPAWATRQRYDVNTTALLTQPSTSDRTTMLRAMLAERFKLSV